VSAHGRRNDFFQVVAQSIFPGQDNNGEIAFCKTKTNNIQFSVDNVLGNIESQNPGVTKVPLPLHSGAHVSVFK